VNFKQAVVNRIIIFLTWVLCKIDTSQLKKIPASGPLILISNHINFLEVPVLLPRLAPRSLTGFVKKQTYENAFFSFLFTTWGGIPIRRGEPDLDAFQKGLDALKDGKIMAISPEGTRSNNGKLKVGYPGVVLIAERSGAPIYPVVHFGGEYFWQNFKKLKRTDFKVIVGNPFHVDMHGTALSREVRQQVADEIMYQMAALLPEENRGIYSELEKATETYLRFAPGTESNLKKAISSREYGVKSP
jgi:1-acyl-sn-glycerol-3-phosphate acyltransferase